MQIVAIFTIPTDVYNQQAAEALSLDSISQTWETQIGIGPTAPLHEGKNILAVTGIVIRVVRM